MHTIEYTAEHLAADLRAARAAATGEADMLARVRAIAARAVARSFDWLRAPMCRPDPQQGFGMYLLHEEAQHELAVFVVSWLPGRGTPPHDHGTWAVVAGIDGIERNTFWRRTDDGRRPGHAEIEQAGDRLIAAGDVLAMRSGAIHSVCNDGDRITASLHIYGRHVNHTRRSRFDPLARTEAPYQVATNHQGARA